MEQEQDEYKLVATKISIPAWRQFIRILHRVGLTAYDAIQNFVDVFIRYGDDRHNLSPDMEKLMGAFENIDGWHEQFNIADPTTEPEITEATYYLRDKEKKGVRVVHTERPWMDGDKKTWRSTWNTKHIMDRFLCMTFPKLYMRLRKIAYARECLSILELLVQLIPELEAEEDKKELRQPFEDASRCDWNGRQPGDQQYKIHHRRTPDGEAMREERQRTINFDEDEDTQCEEIQETPGDIF